MFVKTIFLMSVSFAVCSANAQTFLSSRSQIKESVPTCTYHSDSTVVYVSQDSIKLAATLTMPQNGKRKVPAVVLMSGTGMQDRDCTMAGHKLFADIADFLSSRGVAVLRTDDRGVGASSGDYSLATTADFADDALAAVSYLKKVKGIDTRRIGLIGHSEGGASISIAASKSCDVAFIISLAGLMTDGLSSVIQQNKDLVAATPITDEDKQRYNAINDIMFHTAYDYAQSDSLKSVLNCRYDEWKKKDDETWKQKHPNGFDHFRYSIYMFSNQAETSWYRFFIRYNPADYLCNVKIPVLAINGTKDIMVNYSQNLGNVRKYLSGNKDVTTIAVADVNHLMLPCERGTQDEYLSIKDNTSRIVLETVWSWIQKRFIK